MVQEYKQYEKMIWKNALNFYHRTNNRIELDDLVAEGNLIFIKAFKTYDPEKAVFSTYLHTCLQSKLRSFWKNYHRQVNTVDDPIEDFEFPVDQTPIVVVDQDCQFVINLVKTQDDSILSTKDKVTKQKLYIHLKEIGWRRNRILNSFQKIREEVL